MNGQWLIVTGFLERYVANSIQQFIDLCSVANISVFVMTHENYGFYLHGRYGANKGCFQVSWQQPIYRLVADQRTVLRTLICRPSENN